MHQVLNVLSAQKKGIWCDISKVCGDQISPDHFDEPIFAIAIEL